MVECQNSAGWSFIFILGSFVFGDSPDCLCRRVSAYPFYGQRWIPGLGLGVRSGMGLLRPKLRHSEPHSQTQTSRTPYHYQTVLGLESVFHRLENSNTWLNSAILTLELRLSRVCVYALVHLLF